jgi:hypothetical protein
MLAEEISIELDHAIVSWDAHVRGCRSCLRAGNNLCQEGDYLAETVVGARGRVEASTARAAPGGANASRPRPLSLLRRTILPFGGLA